MSRKSASEATKRFEICFMNLTGYDGHDTGHVVLGFSVGGNAAVLPNCIRAGVVGCEREPRIAKRVQHHRKIAGGPVEVLHRIARVNAEVPRRRGHQLTKANGASARDRILPIGALDFDIGTVERQPITNREIRAAQPGMTGIAEGGGLDGRQNINAG